MILRYLKHFLVAHGKKGFGIHSPFLFHLVSEIINDFTPFYCFDEIENERKKLLANNHFIDVNDLGTGSSMSKSNQRKISNIAKTSLKPKKQAQLLFRLVNYFNPNNILELGTSLGITTSYLATVSSHSKVISLEGCSNIATEAEKVFNKLSITNIDLHIGNINNTLNTSLNELKTLDFAFFDGNHTKEATLSYFIQCLKFKNNDSVFVFDDIYLTKEMQEAWAEIKANKEVIATLDLFYLGIVFFRPEMTKEHLKVRF